MIAYHPVIKEIIKRAGLTEPTPQMAASSNAMMIAAYNSKVLRGTDRARLERLHENGKKGKHLERRFQQIKLNAYLRGRVVYPKKDEFVIDRKTGRKLFSPYVKPKGDKRETGS